MHSSYSRTLAVAIVLLAGSASAQERAADAPPRRIYVPVDELDAVFDRDKQGVLLPRQEFQRLYDAARQNAASQPNTPDAIVLSRADYDARIEGEQLLLKVTARVTNFHDGWSQLALPAGGLGIENALVDDKPARLGRSPDQPNVLLLYLSETGEHTLSVELSAPLTAVGSDKAAGFELFAAPSGVFRITLPAGKFLTLSAVQVERPGPADQAATYEVPIGGQKNLSLRITDRQAQATGDALIFAQTAFGVYVAPGEVTWTAKTELQVYGRSIDRLVCTVPNTLEITGVESTGLESWTLGDAEGAPGRTSITLSYRQPFDGTREITFRGVVSAMAAETWSVPDLTIQSITSHVGRIVVQHPPGVRAQLTQAAGVRPVLADGAQDAALALQYEVWQEGFSLSFTTSTKEREVHAAMTTLLDVNARGLDLFVTLDVSTLFAPLFDVRLRMPAEWNVTSASLQGQPADWQSVPQEAGINEVRIPLNPPLNPGETRQITVAAHRDLETWPVEATPQQFAIPEVRLPQASVVEALYGITADDDLDLLPIDVTGLDPARTADVELLNGKLQPLGKTVRLGFTYQDSVFTGQLEVSRKPSRVSAATVTVFRIDRETLFSHLEARLNIAGGGVRELQVAVSETAGTDLRFQLFRPVMVMEGQQQAAIYPPPDAIRIVEQSAADPQNGLRTWTLQLDRRARGDLVLLVDVTTPRDVSAASYSPFVLNVLGADRQSGHIAIEAGNEQQVTVTATSAEGTPLPVVDPVDFPLPTKYTPVERVVAGFQYVRPGWQMTVAEARFDRQAVPTAVVHSSKITSVLGKAGDFQHQADLEFTAIGVQSLKLQLPEGARLWATLIDGNPVEVRKETETSLLITLPAADNAGQRRTLRLMYRTAVPALDDWSGRLQQTPPQLSIVTGDGTEQPLDVLQQEWVVHHPHETLIVDSDGRFHSEADLDRDSLLGRLGQAFHAPSPREIWASAIAVAIVIVVAWVLSLGYRRFRVLGLVLSCGIVFVVGMVFLISFTAPKARMAIEFTGGAPQAGARTDSEMDYSLLYSEAANRPGGPATPAMVDEMSATMEGAAPSAGEMGGGGFGGGIEQKELSDALSRSMGMSERAPAQDADFALPPPAAAPSAPPVAGADEAPPTVTMAVPGGSDPVARPMDTPFRQGSFGIEDQSGNGALAQTAPSEPAAQPAVGGPGPGVMADGATRFVGTGGLLSLALNLQPPDGFDERSFQYYGNEPTAADLDLTYADRTAGRMLTLAVAAGIAFLCWCLRNRSVAFKAQMAVVLIGGPIAVMTIAAVAGLPLLDGLFLGGLIGVGLWILHAIAVPVTAWYARCCRGNNNQPVKAAALMLGAWCLLSASELLAQEANPAPGDQAPAAPLSTLHSPLSTTHFIFPSDPAGDQSAATLVLIPHDQFLKLWNQAHPEDKKLGPAPVDGLIAEALYAARLQGADEEPRVAVTARYVLHNLRKGQITLPLPLGQVALESSRLDGNAAPLIADNGALRIVLNDPGVHLLDVEFYVAARTTGPAGEFTLPLQAVAAGRLSFTLPDGENLLVRVNGATGTFRLREADGKRVIDTAVDRGGDVTVAWQPKAMRGVVTGVVHVEAATAVNVDDAGLHLSAGLMYRVRQGALNDLSFALPAGLNLQKVAGPDVGGWELTADGDARTLRVFLRRAVEDETQITLDFYQPLAVGDEPVPFSVPQVVPQDVTRETGVVALYAANHLALRVDTITGAAQINLNQFVAPVMPNPPTYAPDLARGAYRYTARPFTITSAVLRRKAETRAVAEHGANVGLRKLMIASRIPFELTGAPRPTVSVLLPPNYLPIDVAATYLEDWYLTDAAGGAKVLTIELDQPRTGSVEVLLEGHIAKQPDDATLSMPLPRPLEVSRLDSMLAVWLDPSYTATLQAFDNWRSIDPAALSERCRALQPETVQFAFSSSQLEPPVVTLGLTRATPQLAADAVTLIAVTDVSLDYGFTLRWKITQAAADAFTLTTPGWLKGRMEFTGAGIRQVTSADVEGGRVRWTIALVDAARDEYLLTAVASLPPPTDLQVAAPDLVFEQQAAPGTFQPLETQMQYALVVNLSGSQLSPVDPNQIDAVSREELPLTIREDLLSQALEIVRVRAGRLPVWRMERLQQAAAATATVLTAQLVTVLDYDGSWRLEATYAIRNRGQQFLALRLPESKVLSVYVRGRPARTVTTTLNQQTIHLVALPQTSISDLSFEVKLVLAGRLDGPLPKRFGLFASELSLPVPVVVSREEATQGGRPDLGTPVVETQWKVFLPDDIDASPVDDTQRTNLTLELSLTEQERTRQDAQALLAALRDPTLSTRNQFACASNLKQIEQDLEKYQGQAGSFRGVQVWAESYDKNAQVLQEVKSELQKFEAAQQEATVARLVDQSESMSQQDFGRNYVLGNSASIATDNRFTGKAEEKSEGFLFNFRSDSLDASKPQDAESKSGEARSKASGGRGELRKQIAEQALSNEALSTSERNAQIQELQAANAAAQTRIDQQQGQGSGQARARGFSNMFFDPRQLQQGMPSAPYLRDDVQLVPAAPGESVGGALVTGTAWPQQTVAGLLPTAAGGDASVSVWTSAGGLSLPIDIPRQKQELTFSKVGGDPQLTLSLRPHRTLTLLIGSVWTLLWIVGGLWVARVLARAGARGTLFRAVPKLLIALGLLGFFLVPIEGLRWTLFALFTLGALCYAFQRKTA